jgi:hypothetical protein
MKIQMKRQQFLSPTVPKVSHIIFRGPQFLWHILEVVLAINFDSVLVGLCSNSLYNFNKT